MNDARACGVCFVLYHIECWIWAGKCAIFGCGWMAGRGTIRRRPGLGALIHDLERRDLLGAASCIAAAVTIAVNIFGRMNYIDTTAIDVFFPLCGLFFALVRRFSRLRFMTPLSMWGVVLNVAVIFGWVALKFASGTG